MASPHWKPFQSPNNQDNATNSMLSGRSYFSSSPPYTSSLARSDSNKFNCLTYPSTSFHQKESYSSTNNDLSSSPGASSGFREAGIVEKLLPSYGFIQCCERQARLFFHYSQFKGNIEHLKLGDPVEFEMTYDRRTGKPIASTVIKINSEVYSEEINSERVTGFITTEISDGQEGRVAYENRGECFFLPFTSTDLEEQDQVFKQKDRVTFYITTDKSGSLRAKRICLEASTSDRSQGVICSLKDSFGFIERADMVKEIFFHSSECKDFKNLNLGDDVEFDIQTRNNKEVAVSVNRLPSGSVIFEDVSHDIIKGKIIKTFERHSNHSINRQHHAINNNSSPSSNLDMFPGKIVYIRDGIEYETSFAEKDVKGEYTLNIGDLVEFNLVTDRRDKMQHASNVTLSSETFETSSEQREQGYISGLKEFYGFIKCLNREGTRIFFRLSEFIDPSIPPELNKEVEFTPAPDLSNSGRLQATRIKYLPNCTIFKNAMGKSAGCNGESNYNKMSSYENNDLYRNGSGSKEIDSKRDDITDNCEFPLIDFNSDLPSDSINSCSSSPAYLKKLAESRFASTHNSWSHILSQIPIDMKSDLCNGSTKEDNNQLMDLFVSPSDCDSSSHLKPMEPTSTSRFPASAPVSILSKNTSYTSNECDNTLCLVSNSSVEENELSSSCKYDLSYKNDYMTKAIDGEGSCVNDLSAYHGKNEVKAIQRGFIAALKESYGFIEHESHKNEVFFHFSNFEGNLQSLDLGHEVEYTLSIKCSKPNAELVRKISLGSIPLETPEPEVYNGKVVRSVRCLNPDQDEYWGLVQVVETSIENETAKADERIYEFSMTSLADIHEYVQKGDLVTFQVGFSQKHGYKRAVNIKPVRSKHQASVDAIKGNFGFLNHEVEQGKKLFFHMSEVRGESASLNPGDVVEFVIVQNQRNGKYSACSVVKLTDAVNEPRPERLINRLKHLMVEENLGPKIVVIRQPRGPDGTRGFNVTRQASNSNGDHEWLLNNMDSNNTSAFKKPVAE